MSQLKVNSIVPSGGLPAGASGGIIQVVQTIKSDTSAAAGPTFVDSGLSVTITPQSSSSKILIIADMNMGNTVAYDSKLRLVRDSTDIYLGDTDGTRPRVTRTVNTHPPSSYGQYHNVPAQIVFLDSPTITPGSPITYKIQMAAVTGYTTYLNRSSANQQSAGEYDGKPASSIMAMEVSG